MLERFSSMVGKAYLQRHVIGTQVDSLEEAVGAGNDYLQIRTITPGSATRTVSEEEGSIKVAPITETVTEQLLKAVQLLATRLDNLSRTFQ